MSSSFLQPPLTAGDKRLFPIFVSTNGVATDITDWVIEVAVWGPGIDLLKTATIEDAPTGYALVTFSPADTASVTTQTVCSVEVQATPPGDGPYTILRDERWVILPGHIA